MTINLDQLARNWMGLADLVAPARCAAVIKANAYGLGADRVIPTLVRAGCTVFFIATPQEGHQARRLAPQADIYALDGLLPGSAESFARDAILPVLSTLPDIETWARLGAGLGHPLRCWLHIDSGLNRLVLTARDARRLAADGALMSGIDVRLVMSHLACADNPTDPKNRDQLLAFETLTTLFPRTPRSLAASDGLMLGPAYHFDLVRPGYALYGGQASISNAAPVAPVLTVTARILAVNDVAPGESVGYAASWRASRPSRIATIAAGYADGVPRSASSSDGVACGHVLIAGHKVPIVGPVSMDKMAILYGPNANNGLISTITKDPRVSQGTTVALGVGNQSVFSGRLRHAEKLSDKFAYKITGELAQGTEFGYVDTVYIGTDPRTALAKTELDLNRDFKSVKGEASLYFTPSAGKDIIFTYGGLIQPISDYPMQVEIK